MSDRRLHSALPIYQFRPELGYPVFLQVQDPELEKELQFLLYETGFSVCSTANYEASIQKKHRLLRISAATPKVVKRITSYSQHAFGLGQELVENFGYYEVYVMMNYAMMIMSQSSFLWEMAFNKEKIQQLAASEDGRKNIRLAINRFLSSALAFHEVMGFWGSLKEGQWIVAPLSHAQSQCVWIDLSKKILFAEAQEKFLVEESRVHLIAEKENLLKEELYSLLATRSLYFSSGQIPKAFMLQILVQLIPLLKINIPKKSSVPLPV